MEGKRILGEGQGQRGEREYGSEAGQGEKLLVGRAGTGKGTGTGTGPGPGTVISQNLIINHVFQPIGNPADQSSPGAGARMYVEIQRKNPAQ